MANGIIDSRNTNEMDNDSVKQSSCKNFLKDTATNLWPEKFGRKVQIWRLMIYRDENLIFLCRPAYFQTRLVAYAPNSWVSINFSSALNHLNTGPALSVAAEFFGPVINDAAPSKRRQTPPPDLHGYRC